MQIGSLQSNISRALAVLIIPLLLLACNASGDASPAGSSAVPTMAASMEMKQAATLSNNTLRITSPLPGSAVTGTLTVRGEGIAFENTFNVDLVSGGTRLATSVVTTDAPLGGLCAFTATLELAPVTAATEGEIHVYTTSPRDGQLDQFASVPVTLVPENTDLSTVTATTNEAEILLSPNRGGPGKQVSIIGNHFPANTDVLVHLAGLNTGATEHVYATLRSNGGGEVKGTFVMPEYWPTGEKILVSQVTVLATTPDFLYKATAEFNFEADPSQPLPKISNSR